MICVRFKPTPNTESYKLKEKLLFVVLNFFLTELVRPVEKKKNQLAARRKISDFI